MSLINQAVRKVYSSFTHNQDTLRLWHTIIRTITVVFGALISGFGYAMFQVPFNLAAGGISGLVIVINSYISISPALLMLLFNIPLLIWGFFALGHWRFLIYTSISAILFAVSIGIFDQYLPIWLENYPITDDALLASIYAGIIVGIGNGLIQRAGGTIGGTAIIGRIFQMRTGIPLSQIYLFVDGAIILASVLVFGWETALHAMLALFFIGLASDYMMEGPSKIRTITIVTEKPQELADVIRTNLRQSSSYWNIIGTYTGSQKKLLFCTIYRSQVHEMKRVVVETDPSAFVVVGQGNHALGGGFLPLKKEALDG